jgi:hypothetical protein
VTKKSYDVLDGVGEVGASRKPPAWLMTDSFDHIPSFDEVKPVSLKSSTSVDSISSAQPEKTMQPKTNAEESRWFSFSSFNLSEVTQKVWEFLCTPVSFSSASTGTSAKPGGDSVTGIGSPTLEPPFQLDRKEFQKLLDELTEMSHQILKINNDTDEEISDKERSSERTLVLYMKMQKKIREDGAMEIKFQLVFHRERKKTLSKEEGNIEDLSKEADNDRKFWSNVNTGLTIASGVVTIGIIVGMVVFPPGGFIAGLAGLSMGSTMQAVLSVSKCAIDFSSGMTQLQKARQDEKFGRLKQLSENIGGQKKIISFRMDGEMKAMQDEWTRTQETVKNTVQLLKTQNEAIHSINAR